MAFGLYNVGHRETKLNHKLCDILKKSGLNAVWESEHTGNTSIDIEVSLEESGHLSIAVECEKYGPTKRIEAVKDAVSRLLPRPLVDVAVAVVYPQECDSELDISDTTMLEYAIITKENAKKYRFDNKRHAKKLKWQTVKAYELANVINSLPLDLGDPDAISVDLKKRLDNGVNRLTDIQRKNLVKSIGLEKYSNDASATRRALLIVASAALFHARLTDYLPESPRPPDHTGKWPPPVLAACMYQSNIVIALNETWNLILKIDYKPIFETAQNVLTAANGSAFTDVIYDLAAWADETVGRIGGLRHDLLGRIFHTMLESARFDGSFYTSVPAAILLSGLAIRGKNDLPKDLKKLRVIDPACGTGTLLMATTERIKDVMPAGRYDSTVIIEHVLAGVDINVTALHMAATTLGLLSPSTKFKKMRIEKVPFGKLRERYQTVTKHKLAGVAAAGSLELYDEGGLGAHYKWTAHGSDNIDSGIRRGTHEYKHYADYVIMNPPFTRHDIRHDQLGAEAEKMVKDREQEIFKNAPVNPDKTSSGIMFLVLEDMRNPPILPTRP